MAASKQALNHTHAHAQCSNASVVLAQARPNNNSTSLPFSSNSTLLFSAIHNYNFIRVGT